MYGCCRLCSTFLMNATNIYQKKKMALTWLLRKAPSKVFVPEGFIRRRSFRLKNKDADLEYEPKQVNISDDKSDKFAETVAPPIAIKSKKPVQKESK